MLIWFNRPQNKEELYNLRHASARNVVERIFGVTKNRFNILEQSPRYAMSVQVCIPPALCALHNFIVRHDPEDTEIDLDEDEEEFGGIQVEEDIDLTLFGNLGFGVITREVQNRASKKRDRLASEMWREYIAFLDANDFM
jgi:hypothetical protein